MTMKLWHCRGARSLRALWALEEMGLDYELDVMPFPPRVFRKDYLDSNLLGTVPYFTDGETRMTESSGICHYLVERYQQWDFGLKPDHPEYGNYLNWLYHSDATLTSSRRLRSSRWRWITASGSMRACACWTPTCRITSGWWTTASR